MESFEPKPVVDQTEEPPALPVAVAVGVSEAAVSKPKNWPEYKAAFNAMLKVPDLHKKVLLENKDKKLDPSDLPPNPEERKVMNTLEESVVKTNNSEWLAELDQDILIRFTRGFVFNQFKKKKLEEAIASTIPLLHHALAWRCHVDASSLPDRTVPREKEFKKRLVNGVSGTDEHGRAVWVLHPPSQLCMQTFKGEDFVLNHAKDMEVLARSKMVSGAKIGRPAYKHVCILDLAQESISMGMIKYLKREGSFRTIDPVKGKEIDIPIDETFYPDVLHSMWVINTPFIFKALWSVAKNFVQPVTRQKFKIHGNIPLEEMQAAGITLDVIPKYMGGKGDDPLGYHYKVKVSAGYEHKYELSVQAGQVLTWDIEVESKDVDVTGKLGTETIVETTRLAAGNCIEGERAIDVDQKVVFVFSNKHSSWSSKMVRYDIRVVAPLNQEILTPKDAEVTKTEKI